MTTASINGTNGTINYCLRIKDDCHLAVPDPNYDRHLLDIESNFDRCSYYKLVEDRYGWPMSLYIAVTYLIAVYVGQRYMEKRSPYHLRGALIVWNGGLAIFSIFGAWRTVTAILYQISLNGFYITLCGEHSLQFQQSLALYFYVFMLSKVVELGDTAFIVLRKTPLIFLHWFHHATVLVFTWFTIEYPSPIQAYFMTINFCVHAIMYPYYFLKVLRVHIPKPISMAITSLQLFQMLGGVFVTMYTYYMRATPGVGCCVVEEANRFALFIYFSYFVLFSQFFIRAYISGKPASAASAKKAIELSKKSI